MDAKTLSSSFGRSSVYTSMIACGGGKNGSGSHANFAVATSHSVRNNPSASNHGVGRVGLERCRGLVRILRREHRGIEQRLRDRTRNLRLLSDKAAAQSNDAAGLVLVFAVQVGGDFL